MTDLTLLRIAGTVGILGSVLYAAGDVLLLAPEAAEHLERRPLPIDASQDRMLRRRVSLLEDLAQLPHWRLRWGALLGVIGGPLTLGGLWVLYRGLETAGPAAAIPPTLLLLAATVAAPYVHGSFGSVGETVHALYAADDVHRPMLADMMRRQVVTVMMAYAPLFLCVIAASVWSSWVIFTGGTRFPTWVAAVNPVTATIAWLLVKQILPRRVSAFFQGASFNLAYIVWFATLAAAVR